MLLLQTVKNADVSLSIVELVQKGGWIMAPILVLLGLTIFFFVERVLNIRAAAAVDANFVNSIIAELRKGDLKAAMTIAQGSETAMGRIIQSGLMVIGGSVGEIEGTMETATSIEVSRMEKNTGYLGMIAGVAPMLGFIGTISGIIRIFYSISTSGEFGITTIAGGLYEKMITSGAGLFVGLIAYVGYHVLQLMIDKFTFNVQQGVFKFLLELQRKNV
ncbi:MAG: MotA/TolQ/ExbB proton channel family protein [Bacteroidia bacterium]